MTRHLSYFVLNMIVLNNGTLILNVGNPNHNL